MEAVVAKELWRYVPPCLLVIGTICNILSLRVMRRNYCHRPNNTAYLLAALAMVDCVVLWTGLPRLWLKHVLRFDIRATHYIVCKLHRYALYLTADLSAWILGIVTFERFVAVCLPARRRRWFRRHTIRTVLAVLVIILFVADSPVLWARGQQTVLKVVGNATINVTDQCGFTSPQARFYWKQIAPWTTLLLYHGGPAAIIVVLNVAIIRAIIIRSRKRRQLKRQMDSATASRKPSVAADKLERRLNSLAPIFLSVTFLFVILNIPSFFNFLIDAIGSAEYVFDSEGRSQLFEAVVLLLMYLNHSINFFAYCLSAAQFRRQFLGMIKSARCCAKKQTSAAADRPLTTNGQTKKVDLNVTLTDATAQR